MLVLFLYVCLGALLLWVLVAAMRARRARYYDIAAAEIHPDLAAGDELLRDVLSENHCADSPQGAAPSVRQAELAIRRRDQPQRPYQQTLHVLEKGRPLPLDRVPDELPDPGGHEDRH